MSHRVVSRSQPWWRVPLTCLLLVSAFPLAAQESANPFTGQPLSLERMHWALEQARLDEQLQASLLNRRKFELERERLEEPGATAGKAMAATGSVALPVAQGLAVPPLAGLALTARNAPVEAPRAGTAAPPDADHPAPARRLQRRPRPSAPESPAPLEILGVRSQGEGWCLLVRDGEALRPLCPGEWRQGHHVEMVSAAGYRLDGHSHALDIPVPQLRQRDTAVHVAAEAPRPMPADEDGGTLLLPADGPVEPVQAALAGSSEGSGAGPDPHLAAPVRSARP